MEHVHRTRIVPGLLIVLISYEAMEGKGVGSFYAYSYLPTYLPNLFSSHFLQISQKLFSFFSIYPREHTSGNYMEFPAIPVKFPEMFEKITDFK